MIFQTNVLGYFYVAAAFIPLLSRSPNSPQVINVTSNAAFGRQAMAGILYSLSKAASTHLTKMLATHLSPISTIRCNAIAPGLFPSELTAGGSDDRNKSKLDGGLEGVPIPKTMGRAGTDAEMACSVLYLASKRQTYTNGSIVFIDGGVLTYNPFLFLLDLVAGITCGNVMILILRCCVFLRTSPPCLAFTIQDNALDLLSSFKELVLYVSITLSSYATYDKMYRLPIIVTTDALKAMKSGEQTKRAVKRGGS